MGQPARTLEAADASIDEKVELNIHCIMCDTVFIPRDNLMLPRIIYDAMFNEHPTSGMCSDYCCMDYALFSCENQPTDKMFEMIVPNLEPSF